MPPLPRRFILFLLALGLLADPLLAQDKTATPEKKDGETEAADGEAKKPLVYVLNIDQPIFPALLIYFRRGLKEAAEAEADYLVLNMDTPGGRSDVMEEMMDLLHKFQPHDRTYTYVNPDALSAGALIACSTRHIYFAEQGIMGAAAAVTSSGEDIQETMRLKVTSAIRARIREVARNNHHRPEVFEAMIDENVELKIGDDVISPKGELLTLPASEAAETFGEPPTPLLSQGTYATLEELITHIAGPDAKTVTVESNGYEDTAYYLTLIGPALFSLGLILGYIEFQTPGFGIFGIGAILCLVVFFFGHYIAGLSGADETVIAFLVLLIGIALIAVEIFLLPGTLLPGLLGVTLMLGAVLWTMVDHFPGGPVVPTWGQLEMPLFNISLSILMTVFGIGLMMLLMPRVVRRTGFEGADTIGSGLGTGEPGGSATLEVGNTGTALTPLHPSGSALFNNNRVDVVSDGRLIAKGTPVRVTKIEGFRVVVEPEPAADSS